MTSLPSTNFERCAKLLALNARGARAAASILDTDELLRWTVDLICAELGVHYAGVYLVDETGQWAVLRSAHGSFFCLRN